MQKIKTIFKKMQCFFRDYYYLLFKSAEENHLRIQRLKKGSSISAGEKSQEIKISLKPFFTKREKIKNGSSSFIVDSVAKQQLESRGGDRQKKTVCLNSIH